MFQKKMNKTTLTNAFIWLAIVLISGLVLFACHKAVTQNLNVFTNSTSETTAKGKVIDILDSTTQDQGAGQGYTSTLTTITFTCQIESGDYTGQVVNAEQSLNSLYPTDQLIKTVESGDEIMLSYEGQEGSALSSDWYFTDYYRFDKILVLGGIFFLLVLLIGHRKGVNTLLSLCYTFLFIFCVFVPAVLTGHNIYTWATVTCIYTIIMTLLIVNGIQKKTLATIIGCISGTIFAALISSGMNHFLILTGYVDERSTYLMMLNSENPINLTAIIFAAITIGAMGAIMDVAMDLSSSLWEICEHVPDIKFSLLFKSGISIGRDIMGTMANTLVLAYIGSSLSTFMLLLTYSSSMMDLLNREIIITELLQALTGSLAILLTIPLTVIVCGLIYQRKLNLYHKKI